MHRFHLPCPFLSRLSVQHVVQRVPGAKPVPPIPSTKILGCVRMVQGDGYRARHYRLDARKTFPTVMESLCAVRALVEYNSYVYMCIITHCSPLREDHETPRNVREDPRSSHLSGQGTLKNRREYPRKSSKSSKSSHVCRDARRLFR